MVRVGKVPSDLRERSRRLLCQLYLLEGGLREFGANTRRSPIDPGSAWPDHLAWGVDSIVAAVRLVHVGQFTGAAQVARSQLERWALNLGYSAQVSRQPGESMSAYYNRLWGTLNEAGVILLHEEEWDSHIYVSCPSPVAGCHPGHCMTKYLSSYGRGQIAIRYEVCDLLKMDMQKLSITLEVGHQILDILELVAQRIRACIMELYLVRGDRLKAASVVLRQVQAFPQALGPFRLGACGRCCRTPSFCIRGGHLDQQESSTSRRRSSW